VILLLSNITVFSQSRKYNGPDDPSGDASQRRVGWMAGNRIYQYFKNNTDIGN
jgi:hypothetical protein